MISLAQEGAYQKFKGIITKIDRYEFYSACKNCFSKLDSTGWCKKCKTYVAQTVNLVISVDLQDSSSVIKVTFFGNDAKKLLELNSDEIDKFSKMNAVELADNFDFNHILARLYGKGIIVGTKILRNEFTNLLEANCFKFTFTKRR